MEGLVKEGSEVAEEGFDDVVLDAGLMGSARRMEHYPSLPICTNRRKSYLVCEQ